jgi:predicted nucleotidyltransferase
MEKIMKHQAVLEKVVKKAGKDRNVLGLLLVGSVASGTHTIESDIDLLMVYRTYKRASGLKNKSYLLHILCDAKILIDRDDTITPVIDKIKEYYDHHPQVADEWRQQYARYKTQKTKSKCEQTSIIQIWDAFEDRYSGGKRIRPFFNLPLARWGILNQFVRN